MGISRIRLFFEPRDTAIIVFASASFQNRALAEAQALKFSKKLVVYRY
jgi:hypothetical protein